MDLSCALFMRSTLLLNTVHVSLALRPNVGVHIKTNGEQRTDHLPRGGSTCTGRKMRPKTVTARRGLTLGEKKRYGLTGEGITDIVEVERS